MSLKKDHHFSPDRGPENGQRRTINFSSPLGTLKSCRLVFASGVPMLELTSEASPSYLYQARFRLQKPQVWIFENILTFEYQRSPDPYQSSNLREALAEISLNGSIPWEIEFQDHVSNLHADLAQLALRSLDVLGSANQIQLTLSRPLETTYIYISSGIRQSVIRLPATAEFKVRLNGFSANLALDDRRFGIIEGETNLESPGFGRAMRRYAIYIAGGARNLTIHRKGDNNG
jgi:hypothetical protein